jgi:hypothetical protein
MSKLAAHLTKAVNAYIKAFDAKYKTHTECVDFGLVYEVADMYLSFTDIVYCINNDIQFSDLYAWYWFITDTKCKINLQTYLRRKAEYPVTSHEYFQIILLNEMIP